jgi:hypothetical protein
MRDIRAVPTRISNALHGAVSLDSTAGRSAQRTRNLAERRDHWGANDDARPVLHSAPLQRSGRYAGKHIHGPNSSYTEPRMILTSA